MASFFMGVWLKIFCINHTIVDVDQL
ncbi:Hypothetical protein F387_00320 [Wohlfahrtiimonas chitiniclastica SH04]|uniref:Uncharacterized protein n=1 Tax=Wohlfahrtiimonas chitiniclastica SH04 TaxID=1261130 RepID=L8Y1L0_9GAMM|nr:Hypothetical protein F387_00320 [Wohlfahrtiimonas chitiniclastica SH04]